MLVIQHAVQLTTQIRLFLCREKNEGNIEGGFLYKSLYPDQVRPETTEAVISVEISVTRVIGRVRKQDVTRERGRRKW